MKIKNEDINEDNIRELVEQINQLAAGEPIKLEVSHIMVLWFDSDMQQIAQMRVPVPVNHEKGIANFCESVTVPEGAKFMIPIGDIEPKI